MTKCAACGRTYFPISAGCLNEGCASLGTVSSSGMASVEPMTPPSHLLAKVIVRTAPVELKKPSGFAPVSAASAVKSGGASASSSSTGENWRDKDARLAREREQKAIAKKYLEEVALPAEVENAFPSIVIVERVGMFFRACGKGQEPLDLLNDGFVHRNGKKSAAQLKLVLANIYSKRLGGARSYMAAYRAAAANNPENAPFISAGIKADDGSGASNAFWQFAMDIGRLNVIPVTAELLGVAADSLSDDVLDVELMINGHDFDTATTRLLRHGPMPECTWLSHVERPNIVAWIRLGGADWQRKWRTFDLKTVEGVTGLALEHGVTITQS